MQKLIQPLERDSGLSSDKTPDTAAPLSGPSRDKLHIVPPTSIPDTQGYTIQDDMQGQTGKLDGLFGM